MGRKQEHITGFKDLVKIEHDGRIKSVVLGEITIGTYEPCDRKNFYVTTLKRDFITPDTTLARVLIIEDFLYSENEMIGNKGWGQLQTH